MSRVRAFSVNSQTFKVTAGTTATAARLLPNVGTSIRLVNTGAVTVYVHVAPLATVAATLPTTSDAQSCLPVLPGEDAIFFKGGAADWYISTITASSTSDLLVSIGEGL